MGERAIRARASACGSEDRLGLDHNSQGPPLSTLIQYTKRRKRARRARRCARPGTELGGEHVGPPHSGESAPRFHRALCVAHGRNLLSHLQNLTPRGRVSCRAELTSLARGDLLPLVGPVRINQLIPTSSSPIYSICLNNSETS